MFKKDDAFDIMIKQLFNADFFPDMGVEEVWRPLTDIYHTDEGLVVKMELAGCLPKDIHIALDGKRLIVSGVKKDIPDSRKVSYQQMEITYGPFRRTIVLPSIVDTKKVKAKYDNGILKIELAFAQEDAGELIVIDLI